MYTVLVIAATVAVTLGLEFVALLVYGCMNARNLQFGEEL